MTLSSSPSSRDHSQLRRGFLLSLKQEVVDARHKEDAWRLNCRILNAMASGVISAGEARKFAVLLDKLRHVLGPPGDGTPPTPPSPSPSPSPRKRQPDPTRRKEFLRTLDEEVRTVRTREKVWGMHDRILNAMAMGTISPGEARNFAITLEKLRLSLERSSRNPAHPQSRG